tara:strand:+ start:308 stop:532 length:225 start_codon:yes stop_codon:yes gene_type:complete
MVIEDNSLLDTTGQVTFVSALFMNIFNYLTVININTTITMLVSLAGLVYIILKIYSQVLDIKEKRKRLKNGKIN